MDNYWDFNYQQGFTSGPGSIGPVREFKWAILNKSGANLQHVIDVGCGDTSFWGNKSCQKYLGIEQSKYQCGRNRILHPDWGFVCIPAETLLSDKIKSAPTVFCIDVLFHILGSVEYLQILRNLASYSTEYIFIYTWKYNPFLSQPKLRSAIVTNLKAGHFGIAFKIFFDSVCTTDYEYQKYRDLSLDFSALLPFTLVEEVYDSTIDPYGCMYIFRRSDL